MFHTKNNSDSYGNITISIEVSGIKNYLIGFIIPRKVSAQLTNADRVRFYS